MPESCDQCGWDMALDACLWLGKISEREKVKRLERLSMARKSWEENSLLYLSCRMPKHKIENIKITSSKTNELIKFVKILKRTREEAIDFFCELVTPPTDADYLRHIEQKLPQVTGGISKLAPYDDELIRFGLTDQIEVEGLAQTLIDKILAKIFRGIDIIEAYERLGLTLKGNREYGDIVIDPNGAIPFGYETARALGYDTIIKFPAKESADDNLTFFLATSRHDLSRLLTVENLFQNLGINALMVNLDRAASESIERLTLFCKRETETLGAINKQELNDRMKWWSECAGNWPQYCEFSGIEDGITDSFLSLFHKGKHESYVEERTQVIGKHVDAIQVVIRKIETYKKINKCYAELKQLLIEICDSLRDS